MGGEQNFTGNFRGTVLAAPNRLAFPHPPARLGEVDRRQWPSGLASSQGEEPEAAPDRQAPQAIPPRTNSRRFHSDFQTTHGLVLNRTAEVKSKKSAVVEKFHLIADCGLRIEIRGSPRVLLIQWCRSAP